MTRHSGRPTSDDVQTALAAMTRDGSRVSVLAQHFGLANTTFRRNFPDVVALLAQKAPTTVGPTARTRPGGARDLVHANAVLRTQNRDLRHQLDLACAQIQRLALENDQLRKEAHAAARVTTLDHRQSGQVSNRR
jgi:hypothetical protein